jgi:formylglycine-generating enzyme required for sulfatase activity
MKAFAHPGIMVWTWLMLSAGIAAAQGAKPLKKCPVDSVVSGTVCMDKYEASVWRVPNATGASKSLVAKIQQGKATAADLTAYGATQLGIYPNDDYAPCANNGQNCANDVYAVSLPGVAPSMRITWFQAQAACKNSRKRLPTNAEWQAAAAGTPDPGPDDGTTDCKTANNYPQAPTGSRTACVSSDGAYDMVGNVLEWVADWVTPTSGCSGTWAASLGTTDAQCITGAETSGEPGALVRGGSVGMGASAGPFAVGAGGPSISTLDNGFRCAR